MVSIGSGVLLVSTWFPFRNKLLVTHVCQILALNVCICFNHYPIHCSKPNLQEVEINARYDIHKYNMILCLIFCSFGSEVLLQQLLDVK